MDFAISHVIRVCKWEIEGLNLWFSNGKKPMRLLLSQHPYFMFVDIAEQRRLFGFLRYNNLQYRLRFEYLLASFDYDQDEELLFRF